MPRKSADMVQPKRLPPLPKIGDIIKLYGLSAKSQLSQNFLLDMNITRKLVRVAGPLEGSVVVEVGPGPGAITRALLDAGVRHVIAVEKDRRFIPSLEFLKDASSGRMDICNEDILQFDIERSVEGMVEKKTWSDDSPLLHIVGNLPFNVSIPLLLQWLALIPQRRGPFAFGRTQMTLTFQKEVAERIVAPPGHRQRSRLSVMVQHLCGVKWGHTLPGSVFVPQPDVDAVVLRLSPLVEPLIDVDYVVVEKVVKALFQHRRKYFSKFAKLLFPESPRLADQLIIRSNLNPHLRPQQLTIEEIRVLTKTYIELTSTNKLK